MSQINPFTGSILQSPQVQRQQSAERDREVRRARETSKNAGLTGDQVDHQVESSEELTPIHKDNPHERRFKRPRHDDDRGAQDDDETGRADDDKPRLDVKA